MIIIFSAVEMVYMLRSIEVKIIFRTQNMLFIGEHCYKIVKEE